MPCLENRSNCVTHSVTQELALPWTHGGNTRVILGLERENGKYHGNYYVGFRLGQSPL